MSITDNISVGTYKGTERNIWHHDREGRWLFCQGAPDASLDGWFTPQELREIADYIEKFQVKS